LPLAKKAKPAGDAGLPAQRSLKRIPNWREDIRHAPPPVLNGLLLVVLVWGLLASAAWLVWMLPRPNQVFLTSPGAMPYVLQLPLALWAGALLGPRLGLACLLLFLVLGLWAPVFAPGTLGQVGPGLGYILAWPVAGWWLGKSFQARWMKFPWRGQQQRRRVGQQARRWLGWCLACLQMSSVAMLAVHAAGLAGLLLWALYHQLPWTTLLAQGVALSLDPLPYDIAATWALVLCVPGLRALLWLPVYPPMRTAR
jgi:biotin transporter BioY